MGRAKKSAKDGLASKDAGRDPGFALLSDGVVAVLGLLAAPDRDAARAEERWLEFERRLAASDTPLGQAARRFRLGRFELRCVVLALSRHIEPRMSSVLGRLAQKRLEVGITVGLALEAFCRSTAERVEARRAFLPSSPLVRHNLIQLKDPQAGGGTLSREMDLSPPFLRYILGEEGLSAGVAKIARLERPEVSLLNVVLPPKQVEAIREFVVHHGRYREVLGDWGFERVVPYGRGGTFLFSGPSGTGKTLLAQALAGDLGRPLLSLSAADLPEREGVEALLRDLFTEAAMRDAIVLVDECEVLFGREDRRKATAYKAIEDYDGILILVTSRPEVLDEGLERRIVYHIPFEVPDPALRRQIWEVHLPPGVPIEAEVDLDGLATRYDFTGGTIKNAVLVAVNLAIARDPDHPKLTHELLEEGCRSQLRYALEALTERTTTHLRLKDIVLPAAEKRKVAELIAACRNHTLVLNRWGFGRRLVTGKGIVALFDGPPGTGKTLCAEIVAGELDRPIHRVNIPEVVSKWVGETEKHIKRVFEAARVSHAMLLFDEADALFSARVAEARTSTDRYSNMEVNLLLQEIERFPGICILTTNSFGLLDKAMVRRVQFRVTFQEPDEAERRAIWETLCPPEAPLARDVNFRALAGRFELTGAQIKNALLRGAYRAAEAGKAIDQATLIAACEDECEAAGKVVRSGVKKPQGETRPQG